MNNNRDILKNSLLVVEDDRIAWIGEKKNLPSKYQGYETQSYPGHFIFPGFVNIHTHAALSILRGIGDDMGVAPAYSAKIPQGVFLSEEDCHAYSLLGGLEALKFGTTCIVDNYIYASEAAKAFAELGMRAVVSERLHDANLVLVPENRYEFDADLGESLLQKNVELIEQWEGAANSRIQTRFGPHAPDTCSTAYLEKVRVIADEMDKGLVIHHSQSPREVRQIKERSGMSVARYLDSLDLLGPDMIAGHCIFVDDDEKALLASTKTHVSHQSGSNAKGGMMAPIVDLKKAGVNIGLGTDNMAGDMIEVLRLAVCTARMREEDNQALNAIDVLEMATINGAKALGLDSEIGSLEAGKKADIIITDFDQAHLYPIIDPVANLVHNGLGSDVKTVFVDGQKLIEEGKHVYFDEPELLQDVQARTLSLWEKIGNPQ
jgi:5-methylthioadenosine/S-adenosylhomocysteine deaminase